MKNRLVSVITPLYHGRKYLSGLYEILYKNAKNTPVEWIVVNDSPNEGQLEKEQFQEKEKSARVSVKVCNHDKNRGIHAARVTGLLAAQGEYVIFLDQDDSLSENAVETLLAGAEKSGADVTVGNGCRRFIYNDKAAAGEKTLYRTKAVLKEVEREKMYLYGTDMIFSPGQCLIRKSAIPDLWKNKILTVNGCDDFLLWLLMFNDNRKFHAVSDKVYVHVDAAQNFSASGSAMEQSFYAVCSYLEETKGYERWKTEALRRRYELKTALKGKNGVFYKIKKIIKNIKTIYYVFSYKIKGYY